MKTSPDITRLACLGEVMIELATLDARTAQIGVAGDTYNTAVYLRRLLSEQRDDDDTPAARDLSVSYITALGDDPMSDRIQAELQQHDLDTDCVERRPGQSPGLYAIETDANGERSFSYWRENAAARSLFQSPARVALSCIETFDLIYLSGISLAILPSDMRTQLLVALGHFRARGGTVAFDSNYRPRLWESQAVAREVTEAMWSAVDIALPSLDDEMALFGDVDEAAVLDRLARCGVRVGALKRGEQGPMDLGPDTDAGEHGSFARVEQVLDTTAAGDSFNAGWLAAFVQGRDAHARLVCGHALASQVVQKQGAIVDTVAV